MSKIVWGPLMSDKDFVKASEKYFNVSRWNLHVGICLLSKVDPKAKIPVVGAFLDLSDENNLGEKDDLDRPYTYALEAISLAKGQIGQTYDVSPLTVLEETQAEDAAKYIVNPRAFVKWATSRWPDSTGHLQLAEEEYQNAKEKAKKVKKANQNKMHWKKWGSSALEYRNQTETAFWKMVADKGLDINDHKGFVSQWAEDLRNIQSETIHEPYSFHTIRGWIYGWIGESQPAEEISLKKLK